MTEIKSAAFTGLFFCRYIFTTKRDVFPNSYRLIGGTQLVVTRHQTLDLINIKINVEPRHEPDIFHAYVQGYTNLAVGKSVPSPTRV